jgi:hypothetical protein
VCEAVLERNLVLAICIRRDALVLVATTTALLAACGSSSSGASSNGETRKTGLQVAKDAAAAINSSGAVHLSGSVPDAAANTPESVDMQLQTEGTSGSFAASGVTVNITRVNGITYVKAPASFYVSGGITAANAEKVANRWLKLPSDSSLNKSYRFADLVTSFTTQESGTIIGKVTQGQVNGQKVVIVAETDGSKLYVAATGTPYPLRETGPIKNAGTKSVLTLSGFGKHTALSPPQGAVDVTKIIPF